MSDCRSTHCSKFIDPLCFKDVYWPHIVFYPKQEETIYSLVDNYSTLVVSGHKMGKDFVSGFCILWYFICSPSDVGVPGKNNIEDFCRIYTTSIKDEHLDVIWDEMTRLIETSKYPLRVEDGGPLIVNHRHIRKVVNGIECPMSYLKGGVAKDPQSMAGHHAPYSMLFYDECSSAVDDIWYKADSWAKRKLGIGNPYPCANFFFKEVTEGDLIVDPEEQLKVLDGQE